MSVQTMHFHAGQEYAMSGENNYDKAIDNFTHAYKSQGEWDAYVEGTIAFLRKDEASLEKAAKKLHETALKDPRYKS